ncbi:MAG: beta-ketoacyl-ACP synthase III [Sandaracinaceae bacterium]
MTRTATQCAVTGSGAYAPPNVVTNEALCAAFNAWVRAENARPDRDGPPLEESSPEWVRKVSGISRRHFVDAEGVLDPTRMCPNIPDRPDDALSVQAECALHASKDALESAGLVGEDIDLVIVGASSLQRPYPALAIELQHAIGARGFGLDISVGCSSGPFAIQLAAQAIAAGTAQRALVCVPEIPSAYSNFRARDSHFILGDASVAVVIEPLEFAKPGAFEVIATTTFSRFSSAVRNNGGFLNRCHPETRDAADKLFYQDGPRVFHDIVRLVPQLVKDQLARVELEPNAVARLWLHQANLRMNQAIAERIAGPNASAPTVLEEYGNTASAGSLLAFHLHHADLLPGSVGVLAAFGAGYTMGAQVLRRL